MSKCFIVLGMHRSATSLTAKGLHDAGVYMGDNESIRNKAKYSPLGFFENLDFVRLNIRILKLAGGAWHSPPSFESIMAVDVDKEIEKLVKENDRDLWGWKDPRNSLTVEKYLPYIDSYHLVCNFRDPLEVDRSLKERNGFPIKKGEGLAREYNRRIMETLKRYG